MRTPLSRTRRTAAALLTTVALAGLSACGDSDDSGDAAAEDTASVESEDTASEDTASEGTADEAGPACTADDIEVAGGFGENPEVTLPDDCSPPTELLSKDLVAGDGPVAEAGSTLVTDYQLVTWSDGLVLDSSFDRGQPFPLENLGNAPVIDGWNEGLVGIKQGTRRLLVVPPDKGYGQGGNGIQPDETLVFVVDAVEVTG